MIFLAILGIILRWNLTLPLDRERSYWKMKYLVFLIALTLIVGVTLFFYFPGSPEAEMEKLSSEEMRDVSGKSLLHFEEFDGSYSSNNSQNSVCGSSAAGNQCLHFARIQMDVEGSVDASIGNATIGHYDDSGEFGNSIFGVGCGNGISGCNGGANADIEATEFGLDGAVLSSPYVELAFREWDSSNTSELVGLRIGAESVNGPVDYQLATLSGSIAANHAFTGFTDRARFEGHRDQEASINFSYPTGSVTYTTGPNLADGIAFNNTNDFWLSINKQDIVWERNNPIVDGTAGHFTGDQQFHTDSKGFWIHATDSVDATDIF